MSGMRGFRAMILAGLVAASPAAAQTRDDLLAGPLAPCLADHFDPERYQSELAADGWLPVPEASRPIALGFLAQTFLGLTHPALPNQSDDRAARIAAAEAQWANDTDQRAVLVQGDALLFLRGIVQADQFRRVDCWMLTPDGEFVDALIASVPSEVPVPTETEAAVALGLLPLTDQAEARIIVTRNPIDPGPFWGILTQTLILPAE